MDSLVIQLQQELLSKNPDVMSILRKAMLIAEKLEINDFTDWINLELNGYENVSGESFPQYRKIQCVLRGDSIQRDFSGILSVTNSPIQNIPPDWHEDLQTVYVISPISEIVNIVNGDNNKSMKYYLPPKIGEDLKKISNATDIYRICDKFKFKNIIEHVINEILQWSSKLEKEGILGKNFIFNDKEKHIAKENEKNLSITYINNSNVQIANDNAQINNKINFNIIANEINSMKEILKDNEIDLTTEKNINKDIEIIEMELEKNEPNNSLIKQSAISLKNIFEGICAEIVAQLLLPHILIIINMLSNIPLP